MSNVLIINAMKAFAHSKGALNLTLTNVAADFLRENGHQVKITTVDEGYDIENEIEKYLWADTVIYQMPGWWMGEPWILKKYIDDVFTAGHGKLYASDGRTRSDATKGYGSGGFIQGKPTCCQSPGTHHLKRSMTRNSSSMVSALMVFICISIKRTNSLVWNLCQHLCVMM